MPEVSDHTGELAGLPVFWRSAPPASAGGATPLYLHGVPTNSDDWVGLPERYMTQPWWRRWWRPMRRSEEWMELPQYSVGFLERSGGLAVDLPGFGRSGKPGNLQYTIAEYAEFLEEFLDLLEIERVSLVVHDWGAVGLAFAQRHPERIARLVVINAIPFLPGYRWHRTARLWRAPLLGELVMGATVRPVMRFSTREARPSRKPMPDGWLDTVFGHFDQGTQRAILRLYRSSPPDVLAAAGAQLGELSMPALVVWGMADPYIPARFGRAYAEAIGGPAHPSELIELPDAGHWPWFDRPDVIDRVVNFLTAAAPPRADPPR
ncbi:MAG TPA: alpha/beta hydrolase [Solirubrobacteraceae bacterium]|nr:alpha/beta hydrolase [Solirubrobacteraceae bacterium]